MGRYGYKWRRYGRGGEGLGTSGEGIVGGEKVWVQVGRYGRGGKVWVQVGRYGRGGEGLGMSGDVW